MKKERSGKLLTFLKILIVNVILLVLLFNSYIVGRVSDFLDGFAAGLTDGAASEAVARQNLITFVSVVFLLLVFLVMSHFAKKFIASPARKIADNMQRVSEGNLDIYLEPKDKFEFREIEVAFNKMVDGLKEAKDIREKNDEQNRQLYAGIAHDLKTPMTMIMGYAKILREKEVTKEERDRYLTIIEQQTKAANSQLEDMLEYARFGSTNYKIYPQEDNIAGLLRGILADMFYRFEDKDIILEPDIPDKVICSYDHEQLKRVFTNLINNAVRHNPENTTIRVSMKNENGVVISFSDNGPFLDEELKEHVFEPYRKGKSGGSGLGLSVVKRIVELHGGTIEYTEDSVSGFKSFVIRL